MLQVIKQLAAGSLYYSGLTRFSRQWRGKQNGCLPPVLMYHRVLPDPTEPTEYAQTGIAVSAQAFERQIAYLAQNYVTLTAGGMVEHLCAGRSLPDNCAVVTFDDGWIDNYTTAYPILKKHRVPATIFCCADFVGTTRKFWFHELLHAILWNQLGVDDLQVALDRLSDNAASTHRIPATLQGIFLIDHFMRRVKDLPSEQVGSLLGDIISRSKTDPSWSRRRFVLNWDEIRSMDPEIIEIGSHGSSHRLLTAVSSAEARAELIDSKQILEQNLNRPVDVVAYPNGAYDDTIKEMAIAAGYRGAFTVGSAADNLDRFALPRIGLHEGATAGFRGMFSRAKFALLLNRRTGRKIDDEQTPANSLY